jgi:hypothetical protein
MDATAVRADGSLETGEAAMDASTAADALDAALVSDAPTEAAACALGQARCAGTSVETCDDAGVWSITADCGSPTPSCCTGACTDLQTDPTNCGACGNVCNAATNPSCSGRCTYVLPLTTGAFSVAVDSTSIYWTELPLQSSGAIMKEPLAGGAAVTLAATTGPSWIAVDSTSVYWTESGNPQGFIVKTSLDGGVVTTLVSSWECRYS